MILISKVTRRFRHFTQSEEPKNKIHPIVFVKNDGIRVLLKKISTIVDLCTCVIVLVVLLKTKISTIVDC